MALNRYDGAGGTGSATTATQTHIDDTIDAHDASAISFTPVGTIASTDAQSAIAEVATDYIAADVVVAATVSAHLADTADAHVATAIGFTPAGTIAASTVQAAIAELDTEKAPLASPTFTGTPAAPTAAVDTNTTQVATTAFVQTQIGAAVTGVNRIINGDMRVDQRNAGASVTAVSAGIFGVDRWRFDEDTDGGFTAQRSTSTPPAGFSHFTRVTITSADASLAAGQYAYAMHRIEGHNISDLDWGLSTAKTVTLSFRVRSSLTGTFGGALRNSAGNRSYPFTYTISAANTWETVTVTIAGDTTGTWLTDTGIGIILGLGVGTTFSGTAGAWAATNMYSATGATSVIGTNGATWDITGVQLEAGSVRTEFERESYSVQLAKCQRYYQQYGFSSTVAAYQQIGYHAAGASFQTPMTFPVEMRAAPTAAVAGTWALANCTGPTIPTVYPKGYLFAATVTALGSFSVGTNSSDDGITFTAEL
jgi:hypothetical protein